MADPNKNWYQRLIAPPDLPDPEARRRAAAVLSVLVPGAVIVSILAFVTPLHGPDYLPTLASRVIMVVLMLVGIWCTRRGRPGTVIMVILPAIWAVVTVMAVISGGVRSPPMVGYLILVMAAGYLWGGRGAMVLGLLSLAAILALALLEWQGLLPDPTQPVTVGRTWATLTVAVLLAGLLTVSSLRSLRGVVTEAQRSERKWAALVRGIPDGIVVVDKEGTIIEVNRGLEAMFDVPRDRLVGRPIYILVPGGFWGGPHVNDILGIEPSEEGPESAPWEAVGLRGDGSEFPVEISLNPAKTDAGVAVIGSIRDVSEQRRMERERKEIEAQLRHSQKMESIGQLAGGIAHDFNNLLTVIMGNTSVDLKDPSIMGELRERLQETHAASVSASVLTGQLLAFGRKQVLAPKAIDLAQVVDETSSMLRRVIGEDVMLHISGDTPAWVDADPNQLEQVILNLAANARDAMPNGGELTLSTRVVTCREEDPGYPRDLPSGDYALLSVMDTGTGMDQDTVARVFEPFFTTKERGRGTGLGLAMVHGIVTQSNGYVRVLGTPGEGSTFEIYLPTIPGPE